MNHRQRPAEPPITGYTRSTTDRRKHHLDPVVTIVAAALVAIAAVGVFVVWNDTPAQGAADTAAVAVPRPTSLPGNTVEYAPPIAEHIGDGTWLVGKEIKRGLYAAPGGPGCYWERLSDLSGRPAATIDNGFARKGPQKVALDNRDFAFTSNGCGRWDLVR